MVGVVRRCVVVGGGRSVNVGVVGSARVVLSSSHDFNRTDTNPY